MASPLVEMFTHNLWANMKVLDACEKLTDEQLDTDVPGTYGSIRSTLLHMFGAEERYAARLNGESGRSKRADKGFTGFDDLRATATQSGQALIAIAEQGPAMEILRYTSMAGEAMEVASSVMLLQAINHGTEHRAHINTGLTLLGVEPQDVDAWAYGDEHRLVKSG